MPMKKHWLTRTALLLVTLWLGACAQLNERPLKTDFDIRPELGVRLRVVSGDDLPSGMPLSTTQQSQQLLLSKPDQALLVVRVHPDQPAARAGIQVGDYIMSLYGNDVSGMRDSVSLMQKLRWGDDINVIILRNQTMQDVWVPLRP